MIPAAIIDAPSVELPTRTHHEGLSHALLSNLPTLAEFDSTPALQASPLFRKLCPEINRLLDTIIVENLADDTVAVTEQSFIRAVAWNIERGKRLDPIIRALREDETLRTADLLLLTEADYGMARSGNRNVAREIAHALNLNYAFAPCYLALDKGNGSETGVEGENTHALHGNALLSRFPLANVHAVRLPNGKDKMRGTEKRLGSQQAIVADVQHPRGAFRLVCLHLDAHSSQAHRHHQMRIVLDHIATLPVQLPILIGGDWNTSGYNSQRALYAILGYWRRVAMGVRNVVVNHYPYPERWFERHLFRELERRRFTFRDLNKMGACTLHYDTGNVSTRAQLADWVPAWCFHFIHWALSRTGNRCSLKLDWFAGQGISAAPDSPPQVLANLNDADRAPLSDHDPIVLDFTVS